MLPNLIIAGAQKSGTTSLHRYLASHPQCVMSRPKETNFFSKASNLADLATYERCFQAATRERDPRRIRVVGESTPSYFAEASVPERIREVLGPDVKIVLLLRDPADRAISAYWQHRKLFAESRGIDEVFDLGPGDVLAAACEREAERIERAREDGRIVDRWERRWHDDFLWSFRYVGNGRYSTAIERFERCFERRNLCILLFEDLVRSPGDVLRTVERFLGIDDTFVPPDLGFPHNRTYVPRSGAVFRLLHRAAIGPLALKLRRKLRVASVLFYLYERAFCVEAPRPDPALRRRLRDLFAPETARLAALLGRDLGAVWG